MLTNCPRCNISVDAATVLTRGQPCERCRMEVTTSLSGRATFLTCRTGTDWKCGEEIDLDQAFRDRFELGPLLGVGASSTVYAAEDATTLQTVAVKFLARPSDETLINQFMQEVRILRQLDHLNVVRTLGAGTTGGHPFIVSELARGGSLENLMKGNRLTSREAVRIAVDLLSGLRACHLEGIVHRDLKPANVLFTQTGRCQIGDFGTARQYGDDDPLEVEKGLFLGTPLYMAPEQLEGEPAGVASDLFTVGVIIYEMLSGSLPFRGATVREQLALQRSGMPELEGVSVDLSTVVELALRPSLRAPSRWLIASDFGEALAVLPESNGGIFADWTGTTYEPGVFQFTKSGTVHLDFWRYPLR